MRVLITGICGFAGSAIADHLLECREGTTIVGIDNLARPGSETNRSLARRAGVEFHHGDIRSASDVDALPPADWVIDAAAQPSVLAGVQGPVSSRQMFEHNLASLANVLEYSRRHRAGLILLSTSRVYSIEALSRLPLRARDAAFHLDDTAPLPTGVSAAGIDARFSTAAPVSLYGGTKLAAEIMALEYAAAFDFPLWINRCGVLAGAGQFGTPDQGIFSYWIHAHRGRRPLRYIGFDGSGQQVRDALHPRDLAALLSLQMDAARAAGPRLYTVGGGPERAMSLAQLTAWCDARFGPHPVAADPRPRLYDIPWVVMDARAARADFAWSAATPLETLLEGIAAHAGRHPDWLEVSGL